MGKKIYTLITILCFFLLSARAQDSAACNAHFQVFNSPGLVVSFQALDSLSNIQHFWDFGDGATAGYGSGLSAITHVYPYPGTYTVRHVIRDSTGAGCHDSTTQQVITDTVPHCPVFVAIVKQDSSGAANLYNFYATTYGGSGDTVRWYIDSVYAGTGPSLTGQSLPAGHHFICARLTTASGCSSGACQVVDVVNTCGIIPSFTYFADTLDPQTIHFTASPDSGTYDYTWNFGDGSGTSGSHPTHTFGFSGSYYVTLTVSHHAGTDSCSSSASQAVYVPARPTCNTWFTYSRNPANPAQVMFNAQDSTGVDSLTWVIFRTDSVPLAHLYGRDPLYTFPDSGCYYVQLLTVTQAGCHGNVIQQICIDSLGGGNNLISSYPNPAPNESNLDLTLDEGNTIFVFIYNSMGHLVLSKVTPGNKGLNHISLPVAGLPKGIYYVQVRYGKVTKRSKIQKL